MSNSRNINLENGLRNEYGYPVKYYKSTSMPDIDLDFYISDHKFPPNDNTNKFLNPKKSKEGKLAVNSPAIHPEFYDPLIAVAEMSIEKGYKPLNWLDEDSTVTLSYLDGAIERHLKNCKLGYYKNTEEKKLDGTPTINKPFHYAQVAYNALMACRLLIEKGDKIDDHQFKEGKRKC